MELEMNMPGRCHLLDLACRALVEGILPEEVVADVHSVYR